MRPITIADFIIERGTSAWGGPKAKITVTAGPLVGRSFWLRSTEGMDSPTAANLKKGGGIHVDATEPDKGRFDWRGSFDTWDMDEAIDGMVAYVNERAERHYVQDATWQDTSELAAAVESFTDSLSEVNARNFREEWQRVQRVVVALDMKIQETLAEEK